MKRIIFLLSIVIETAFTSATVASEDSMGPNGINSIVTGLKGTGIPIAQLDTDRPGIVDFDTDADCCNVKVQPAGVLVRENPAAPNDGIGDHGLWVASIMISSQTTVAAPNGVSPPVGVAPEAVLYSSALLVPPFGNLQQDASAASQILAGLAWGVNVSLGLELEDGAQLDGNSIFTQFIDWSTVQHETLYVVAAARPSLSPGGPVPTDNYNGITVGVSKKSSDGVFRIATDYYSQFDPVGGRTATVIIAPGFLIDVAGPNGTQPPRQTGSSMAAPHVTGTIALLHERANTTNGRRHQTKKAILLNSADKIKGVIGMERTVETTGGSNWFGSFPDLDPTIPLDPQMGVGHLNAKRAIDQLDGGEHAVGPVPNIGWDYASIDDPFIPNPYILNLSKGDYVSATLVWDREVLLNSPFPDYQRGDTFADTFFEDLNLYLVRAGEEPEQAIKASISTEWNLEHIFAPVPADGDYEILVDLTGEGFVSVNYAIAWWAGSDDRNGDNNGDGKVDGADYVLWRHDPANYGGTGGYDTWRSNFGAGAGSGSGQASVPEPSSAMLLVMVSTLLVATNRNRYG